VIIKTAEYLNTKYKEDQIVNIFRITINQTTKYESTNQKAAKFKEELNQSTENKETKNKGIQHMKAKLGGP
jgi:hypothetical protein